MDGDFAVVIGVLFYMAEVWVALHDNGLVGGYLRIWSEKKSKISIRM